MGFYRMLVWDAEEDREPSAIVLECRAVVREIDLPIALRCIRWAGDTEYEIEQSHFIASPGLANHYVPSFRFDRDPSRLFGNAAIFLNYHFQWAVEWGHKPKRSWFVRNPEFSEDWIERGMDWRTGRRQGRWPLDRGGRPYQVDVA